MDINWLMELFIKLQAILAFVRKVVTKDREIIEVKAEGNLLTVDGIEVRVNSIIPFVVIDEQVAMLPRISAAGVAQLLAQEIEKLSSNEARTVIKQIIGAFVQDKGTPSVVKEVVLRKQAKLAMMDAEDPNLIKAITARIPVATMEQVILQVEAGITTGRAAADGRINLDNEAAHASIGLVVRDNVVHTPFKKHQIPARFQLAAHLTVLRFAQEDQVEFSRITGLSGIPQNGMKALVFTGSSRLFAGGGCIISRSYAERASVKQAVQLLNMRNVERIDVLVSEGDVLTYGSPIAETETLGELMWEGDHDLIVEKVTIDEHKSVVWGYYVRPLMVGDKIRTVSGLKSTITEIWADDRMPVNAYGAPADMLIGRKSCLKNPAALWEMAGGLGAFLPEHQDEQNALIAKMERHSLTLANNDIPSEFRSGHMVLNIEGPGVPALSSVKQGKFPISSIALMQLANMPKTLRAFQVMQERRRKQIVALIGAACGQGYEMPSGLSDEEKDLVRAAIKDGSLFSPYLLEEDLLLKVGGEKGRVVMIGEVKLVIPPADTIREYFSFKENKQPMLNRLMVAARRLLAEVVMPMASGYVNPSLSVTTYYEHMSAQLSHQNIMAELEGIRLLKLNGRIEFSERVPVDGVIIGSEILKKAGFPRWVFGSRTPTISQDALVALRVYEDMYGGGVIRLNPVWAMVLMNADCDGDGISLSILSNDLVEEFDLEEELEGRAQQLRDGSLLDFFKATHYGEGVPTKYDEEMDDATAPAEWTVEWKSYPMEDVRRMIAFAAASQGAVGMATNTVSILTTALVKAVDLKRLTLDEARRIQNAIANSIQGALDGMKHVDIDKELQRLQAEGGSITDHISEFDGAFRGLLKAMDEKNPKKMVSAKRKVFNAAELTGIPLTYADLDVLVDSLSEPDVELCRQLIVATSSSAKFSRKLWNDLYEQAWQCRTSPIHLVKTMAKYGKKFGEYHVPTIVGKKRFQLLIEEMDRVIAKNKVNPKTIIAVAYTVLKENGKYDLSEDGIARRMAKAAKGDFSNIAKLDKFVALAILKETEAGKPGDRILAAYKVSEEFVRAMCAAAVNKTVYESTKPKHEHLEDLVV